MLVGLDGAKQWGRPSQRAHKLQAPEQLQKFV